MIKNNFKNKSQSGYILAFTLILVAVLLTVSLSVSRIISKELFFSRLIEYGKGAYFAAESGIECGEYLDNVFKNQSSGISIILNSANTGDEENSFISNANDNIFNTQTSTSGIVVASSTGIYKISDIVCGETKVFNKYSTSITDIKNNLNNSTPISSFNITGDFNNATTTFSLILPYIDNGTQYNRCAIVTFVKNKGQDTTQTKSYTIISTGYSSCNLKDSNIISRTSYRYSND